MASKRQLAAFEWQLRPILHRTFGPGQASAFLPIEDARYAMHRLDDITIFALRVAIELIPSFMKSWTDSLSSTFSRNFHLLKQRRDEHLGAGLRTPDGKHFVSCLLREEDSDQVVEFPIIGYVRCWMDKATEFKVWDHALWATLYPNYEEWLHKVLFPTDSHRGSAIVPPFLKVTRGAPVTADELPPGWPLRAHRDARALLSEYLKNGVDEKTGYSAPPRRDYCPAFAANTKSIRKAFEHGEVPWKAHQGGPLYHSEHPIAVTAYLAPGCPDRYYVDFHGPQPSDAFLVGYGALTQDTWMCPPGRPATVAEKAITCLFPPSRKRSGVRQGGGSAKKPKVKVEASSAGSDSPKVDSVPISSAAPAEQVVIRANPATFEEVIGSYNYDFVYLKFPDDVHVKSFEEMAPISKLAVASSLQLNAGAFAEVSKLVEDVRKKNSVQYVSRKVKTLSVDELALLESASITPRLKRLKREGVDIDRFLAARLADPLMQDYLARMAALPHYVRVSGRVPVLPALESPSEVSSPSVAPSTLVSSPIRVSDSSSVSSPRSVRSFRSAFLAPRIVPQMSVLASYLYAEPWSHGSIPLWDTDRRTREKRAFEFLGLPLSITAAFDEETRADMQAVSEMVARLERHARASELDMLAISRATQAHETVCEQVALVGRGTSVCSAFLQAGC